MEVHITLYGQHAERFEDLKEDFEESRGLEATNADVLRELMIQAEL